MFANYCWWYISTSHLIWSLKCLVAKTLWGALHPHYNVTQCNVVCNIMWLVAVLQQSQWLWLPTDWKCEYTAFKHLCGRISWWHAQFSHILELSFFFEVEYSCLPFYFEASSLFSKLENSQKHLSFNSELKLFLTTSKSWGLHTGLSMAYTCLYLACLINIRHFIKDSYMRILHASLCQCHAIKGHWNSTDCTDKDQNSLCNEILPGRT